MTTHPDLPSPVILRRRGLHEAIGYAKGGPRDAVGDGARENGEGDDAAFFVGARSIGLRSRPEMRARMPGSLFSLHLFFPENY
jgi:hypothetical protein